MSAATARVFNQQGRMMNKLMFPAVYIYLMFATPLFGGISSLCSSTGLIRKRGMMMRRASKRFWKGIQGQQSGQNNGDWSNKYYIYGWNFRE